MIVYGKNVFNQIKEDPRSVSEVYILESLKDKKLRDSVKNLKCPVRSVSRKELDILTGNGIHNGIAVKVKDIPTYTLDELLARKKSQGPGLYVALDNIQDPHNVGSILRTADCTGVDGIILCRHNSAGLTPTVVKTSTGAAYTVPVAIVNNLSQALKKMKEEGYWIAGADMDHARDYREGMYDALTVLVIGSEGKGISPLVKKQCDYMVRLPMAGSISSLNASVACAVLLYEIMNQRDPLPKKNDR